MLSRGRSRFQERTLVNVLAMPLGIRLDENTFKPVVEGNKTVPHRSAAIPVTTTYDNQPRIEVEVLQGPRLATRADECVLLGSLEMEVPLLPARSPKFEVVLDVQADGTLQVIVRDRAGTAPRPSTSWSRGGSWRGGTNAT
jgi:molecular chaperone DnaK (HSP70)